MNTSKNKFLISFILALWYLIFSSAMAWSAEYSIIQLSNNDYYDSGPQIHNGQVTWYGYDGHDYEIFLYKGEQTISPPLTNNSYNDYGSQIHNGQVTWYGYDGNDYEIFLYTGTNTLQLTDNDYSDFKPQIHNGQVTWYGYDGNDYEIFCYDGSQIIQLTDNNYDDVDSQIDNGQIVWRSYDGHDYEVFFYDGSQTIQLTDNEYTARTVQIHNAQVVWDERLADYVSGYMVFFYDGSQTIQLTDNEYFGSPPQIHNGQVVWSEYVENPAFPARNWEVFFYDGNQTIQLTSTDYNEVSPEIHNGQIVWHAFAGEYYNRDYEIFLYDGTLPPQQLTSSNSRDSAYYPQIHNAQVVWYGHDGNDFEIFLAIPAFKTEIILTFDDGPVGTVALGTGDNSTESILNDLESNDIENGIKAAFFIQTHDSKYGGSSIGTELIIRENNEDHVIGIHTGGEGRHFKWTDHVDRVEQNDPEDIYDANGDGAIDANDGQNALECDLIAAILKIKDLTGRIPEFVRPPYWKYNQAVLDAYKSQTVKNALGNDKGLKMILTDAIGADGGLWWLNISSIVSDILTYEVRECIEQGINQIVVTLHDTNTKTAKYLNTSGFDHSSYLDSIVEGIKKGLELETREEALEHTQFVTSSKEIRQILMSK